MLKVLAAVTGTFDTVVAGATAATIPYVFMGQSYQKVKELSATLIIDAETDTITVTARWQGSNDASTWVNISHGTQNAAGVVLATGTAGADAAVTLNIPAPANSAGWKYLRCAPIVGVTTGAAVDTWSVQYRYHQISSGATYA